MSRRLYYAEKIGVEYQPGAKRREVSGSEAEPEPNLISSEDSERKGYHRPAIDIDLPCYLTESKTPGHFHLYISVSIPWWRYRVMLWGMRVGRVIEPGYYRASVSRKATFLRITKGEDVTDGL